VDRRRFLRSASAVALAAGSAPVWAQAKPTLSGAPATSESVVARLFGSLTERQKKVVSFAWGHQDPERGLLRTRVSNNWKITEPEINSDFYSDEQREMIRDIFEGLLQADWIPRFDRQLKDDTGGFGQGQSIALFGTPGEDKFEFVLTGRHMTLRCDGNSTPHVAFGGPIFYGHAAGGHFRETARHPGNIFWPQAVAANALYQMLDGKQRKMALVVEGMPPEQNVRFQGARGPRQGIRVTELSADQKAHLQGILKKLIAPYRQTDRDEVIACLNTQGGLDPCRLAFYQQRDIGGDGVWDVWRLEGPAFVWHFRGAPHVHVWVNVANDPSVKLNA